MSRLAQQPGSSGAGSLKHAARLRIRHFVSRYLAPISRHPAMTVTTGVGLFISGIVELAEQIFTNFESMVGIHQGVILLGIVTFLRGLADLVEASEWLSRGTDDMEAESRKISKAAALSG
jgi:hypothetical protein